MAKQKVLFVAYGGGHVNMIIPLIKALRRNHHHKVEPIVLALTTAKSALDTAGIDALTMHDFVGKKNKTALAWGEKLANELTHSKLPYTETVAYLGLNYKDLIDEVGEEKAAELYAEKGRHAFLPVKLMRTILSQIKPALVVTTNSPRSERAAIIAAKSLGIPSVCIIDLFPIYTTWIWEKDFADKVCVLNDTVKSNLISRGRPEQDIVSTGNPAFDDLFAEDIDFAAERMRAKKNWGTKKVLLWASQPEPAINYLTGEKSDPTLPRRIDDYLIKTFEKHPEWQLVIRPHPSEQLVYNDLPTNVEISTQQDSISPLLHAVDAAVVTGSTVGIQAGLINKPIYQFVDSVIYQDIPLDKMGYATSVPSIEAFEHIFFHGKQELRKRHPAEIATPKVINVIMEALQIYELRYFGNVMAKHSSEDLEQGAQ